MSKDLNALCARWTMAKADEADAIERRRKIEDEMAELLKVDAAIEATTTAKTDDFVVKISTRLTRKVDADKIQEAAAEAGLSHILPSVCRWKPELDMRVWKGLDESARKALAPAITTTASRPSFSMTAINKE